MTKSHIAPRKEIKMLFESTGLGNFAVVDPLKAFSDSNELWMRRQSAFNQWIDEKKHGSMSYLEINRELRSNPLTLLPGVKSAIVFLVPYSTGRSVRRQTKRSESAFTSLAGYGSGEQKIHGSESSPFINSIARYARHKDYHKVLKTKIIGALEALQTKEELDFKYKIAIDSVPFLDRAHAELAGLGFVGKNTMIIRPGLGSYFFIASVLLDLDLCFLISKENERPSNAISRLTCNDCTKCVDACPTKALDGHYQIDATRCFSYWSIESRSLPPDFVKPAFKDLFFGCDICQQVCPYNHVTLDERRFPEFVDEAKHLRSLDLEQIAVMTKNDYEKWFGGLPLTRAKYSGLIRNALYALAANANQNSLQKVSVFWATKRQELEAAGQFDKSYALIFEALEDIL